MKVRHDGKVWNVFASTTLDGEQAYTLTRPGGADIVARISECGNPIKPRTRRIRDAKHVLEFHSDGTLKVRRCRSPRRYPISLESIYELAVRMQVFKNGRVPKSLRARGRR
jgi:hypothetical protein